MALSSDDGNLIIGLQSGIFVIWDSVMKRQKALVHAHKTNLRCLAISPDGRTFATGSEDKTIKIWAKSDPAFGAKLWGHNGWVLDLAYSPNGDQLASASFDKTVIIWDMKRNIQMKLLSGHESSVLAVAYSQDGKYLATGDAGSAIIIWDTATWEIHKQLNQATDEVSSLMYSASSRYLASGTSRGRTIIWDTSRETQVHVIDGHQDVITALAYAPNNKYLLTASKDKQIKLWFSFGPLMDILSSKARIVDSHMADREKAKRQLLAKRGKDETDKAYEERQQKAAQAAAVIDSVADITLITALASITIEMNVLLYQTLGPIETNEITLGQYDPNLEHFAISVFDLNFRVPVPISTAPQLKKSANMLTVVGERQISELGDWKYYNLTLISPGTGTRHRFDDLSIPRMPVEKLIERRKDLILSIQIEMKYQAAKIFTPRGEFEPEADYLQRKARVDAKLAAVEANLQRELDAQLAALEAEIYQRLPETRKNRVFSKLTLSEHNPTDAFYPITLEKEQFQVPIPTSSAAEVKKNSAKIYVEAVSQLTLPGIRKLYELVLIDPVADKRYGFGDALPILSEMLQSLKASNNPAFFTTIKFEYPNNLTVETKMGGE